MLDRIGLLKPKWLKYYWIESQNDQKAVLQVKVQDIGKVPGATYSLNIVRIVLNLIVTFNSDSMDF